MARSHRYALAALVAFVVAGVLAVMAGAILPAGSRAAVPPKPLIRHGYKYGPIGISPAQLGEIARLDLPAGKYAITGKAWLTNGSPGSRSATCRLQIGGTWDQSGASMESSGEATLALSIAVTLSAPTPVQFMCKSNGGGGLAAHFLAITATKAGTLRMVAMN